MNYKSSRPVNLMMIVALQLSFYSIQAFSMEKTEEAIFAGGCFWCVESNFEKVPGVVEAISGYTGGKKSNPTYKEVGSGKTSHTEAVLIKYDPSKVSYENLLQYFWRTANPTDLEGQFVDRGSQYRPEIFYKNETQKTAALKSKKELEAAKVFPKPIVIPITKASKFYKAEDYHQDYHSKNPIRYAFYRSGSGRDKFLKKVWGDNFKYDHTKIDKKKYSKKELKRRLSKVQYYVTQEDGTEPPFRNKYNDNKKAGIYVDIVSGEPLFSSTHKFDSGTGWPSFYKPLVSENIVEKEDNKLFMKRVEVRSKGADSHLGHVFTDGPKPTGLRYCINSAALDFIPVEQLKEKGLGKYLSLFKGEKK